MAYLTGTDLGDTIYIPSAALGFANSCFAYGGNDTVYGSSSVDQIDGGAGNDIIYGNGGNDILLGGIGNDTLYGGANDDQIFGGAGGDYLYGDAGKDTLSGGSGDDNYIHKLGTGTDFINDNLNSDGISTGVGGGLDTIYFLASNLYSYRPSSTNNLAIATADDLKYGVLDDGVIIENFYLKGATKFMIERLVDGFYNVFDLTILK